MNCANCGAAMELLSDRGYFYCRYCGSFHFPDDVEGEGAILAGPAAPPQHCPLCAEPLSAATIDGLQVLACPRCKGMLMPRRTFGLVATRRRAAASGSGVIPSAARPFDAPRHLTCPSCGARMLTHPYYGPGNIIIDTCERCDSLWLDPGELTRVVDAPGKDRG